MHSSNELKARLALITRLLSNQVRGWSIKEVSQILGLSESTLYREIKSGKLHTYKLSGSTRIRHAELIRYNLGNDPIKETVAQLHVLIGITEQNAKIPADPQLL
jgi:excisionase family DNA binding protein